MTQEDEKFYEAFFELFLTDGWKQLVEKCTNQIDAYDIEQIPDEKTLRFVQGQLSILKYLANLDNVTHMEYENAKEEE